MTSTCSPLSASAISPEHRRNASFPNTSARQPRSAGASRSPRRDLVQIGARGDQFGRHPFIVGFRLQKHAQQIRQRRVDLKIIARLARFGVVFRRAIQPARNGGQNAIGNVAAPRLAQQKPGAAKVVGVAGL